MARKRQKGYWEKRVERFPSQEKARARAGQLRLHKHVAHVKTSKSDQGGYVVTYSAAKWYLEELARAGTRL